MALSILTGYICYLRAVYGAQGGGCPFMNQSHNVVAKKKRRLLFLFQLSIVVGVLLFTWFSFGRNVLAPAQHKQIPDNLGKMELVGSVEGGEAISQIGQLHGSEIKLESAFVANYGHRGERATVWVGNTSGNDAAGELMARMVNGITTGSSGFSNLQEITVGEQAILMVNGPGGQHFFYQQASKVVWLAIESTDAMSILKLAIRVFRE
jgi:hypothetical protein